VVVHAGLVPGLPLEDQRPFDMVMMRNLSVVSPAAPSSAGRGDHFAPHASEEPGSGAWAKHWPGTLTLEGEGGRERGAHVYFGHDAKRKLQLHPHATGLDTGCLYGGELTAAVLELGQPPRLVHVPARRAHIVPGVPPARQTKAAAAQQASRRMVLLGATLAIGAALAARAVVR
jgi:hypothetical protein